MSDEKTDVIILGSGPAGLQAACTAKDLGLTARIIDRRGLAHSFVQYPQTLRFFSPPDEMAIGGVPFPMRGGEKPTREDILPYFRAVAASRKLTLSLWEEIIDIQRQGDSYLVTTLLEPNQDEERHYSCRAIVLASGVWEHEGRLGCPGDTLPHVAYRFHEPTEYFGMPVAVVGGGNSAVYAALTLAEAGASVTLAMRRKPEPFQSHLRPFVVRDLMMAVDEKRLTLLTDVNVECVEPELIRLRAYNYEKQSSCGEAMEIPARFVFAMVGQQADTALFERMGLCLEPDGRPSRDETTFETNLPNVFVAGSLAGQKIDIVLLGREQSADVVRRIADRLRQ